MQTVNLKNALTVAQSEFIAQIGGIKMPRFVAINGYKNEKGDISDYLININHKYKNKVKKDVGQLKAQISSLPKTPETALEYMAATELLNSFLGNSDRATASAQSIAQRELYEVISGSIKRHTGTGKYYLFGYCKSKTVIYRAERKPVKSRELTISKDKIRKTLRTAAYVNFSLSLENFSVTLQGSTLILTAL